MVTKMLQFSQIFKREHCISEASSGETEEIPMETLV
jgi:hypothetical protein